MKGSVKVLLVAAGLAAVLPATRLGHGCDLDAWRVAGAARAMLDSATYVPSRPPGFPLFEMLATPLVGTGSGFGRVFR